MNRIDRHQEDNFNLVDRAKALLDNTAWLIPVDNLLKTAATEFGHNIVDFLHELDNERSLTLIQLHKRDKAVVMGVEHYLQLLKMSKVLESMLEKQRIDSLTQDGDEFEIMFQSLTGKSAGNAATHLLNVGDDDLASTFKPGGTETS